MYEEQVVKSMILINFIILNKINNFEGSKISKIIR